ncbi:hypothetical protein N2W54_000197 [Lotmaria passim]
MQTNKAASKRRTASRVAKDGSSFDPAAYAALIAISAAEKRLRESHSRGASSSTARPSSLCRPPGEPSSDLQLFERAAPPSHTTRDSRRVEEIVARYRPQPPRPALQSDAAAPIPRTQLEQLALESESSSSIASEAGAHVEGERRATTMEKLVRSDAATPLVPVLLPHEHRCASRALSSPAPSPLPASPPPADPTDQHRTGRPEEHEGGNDDYGGDDVAVSLRDASPLREQSVVGTSGISYRVSAVENIHAVAQQLNFALYP